MSTFQESEPNNVTLTDQAIAAYLRKHPDFFRSHSTLLEELNLPHASGDAVSLIERQVGVLRDKNHALRKQLHELVEIARDNDKLNENLQKLTVALIDATSLEEKVRQLQSHLRDQFSSEQTALALVRDTVPGNAESLQDLSFVHVIDKNADSLALFETIVQNGQPVCGRLKSDQLEFLFGESASAIQSAAVIPLKVRDSSGATLLGLLAIGSKQADRFHTSMGTSFLTNLGQIVTHLLKRT
jgi:uncharacterized protein YigA (DUF484 family)